MWVNQFRWADRPCTAIALLALLLGAPTIEAQAVNPMDALQFYVGRWSCVGGQLDVCIRRYAASLRTN
jgi:hypothetical protein